MVCGIVGTTAYQEERILVMKPGETVTVGGYDATFSGVKPQSGPNYREDIASFDISRGGSVAVTTLANRQSGSMMRHRSRRPKPVFRRRGVATFIS